MSGNLNITVVFAVVFLGYPEIFADQEKNFFFSHHHLKSVRIDAKTEMKG